MSPETRRCALLFTAALASCTVAIPASAITGDWHYPAEEPSEREAAPLPIVRVVSNATAVLLPPGGGSPATVAVGDVTFGEWHVAGLLPDLTPSPCVVLEREFDRWGLIAFVFDTDSGTAPRMLRKSGGRLAGLDQPRYNFTGADPDYFDKCQADGGDYPSQMARRLSSDGELRFETLAQTLAPQRDIAAISLAADVVKFGVTHTGRIKCGTRNGGESGGGSPSGSAGLTELQDARKAPPDAQTVIFDPAQHVSYWPSRYEHTKSGLVGGSLNVANVAAFSPNAAGGRGGRGYDLVAFSPVFDAGADADSNPTANQACGFTDEIPNTYVAGFCAGHAGHDGYNSLEDAKAACSATLDCNGITHQYGVYQMRAGSVAIPAPAAQPSDSWLVINASKPLCHTLPRLPGINYAPSVLVRLREQVGAEWTNSSGSFRYFRASNSTVAPTAPTTATATEFYTELLRVSRHTDTLLAPAMRLRLPGPEGRRQIDMSHAGMLGALNNYVGNQSNYGFGATYWSVGREDNGSLPLNWLSTDEALLEWGMCNVALDHMGFYFDNYVMLPSGEVNYYTWGGVTPMAGKDSLADTGRMVGMYLRAQQLCPAESAAANFAARYLPHAEAMGRKMLSERAAAAASAATAPAGCAGLVQGAPEHDWGGTTDLYFYNNNAWQLRGMELLGDYLTSSAAPAARNATLGQLLLADAIDYRGALTKSVSECTIANGTTGVPVFLPPYAHVNATPYVDMTTNREASYANFRFWSETLMAEQMPSAVEAMWLRWHNERGGRVGGASHFEQWLDDMPTAGWGFGALANNQTDAFHALLYGHMATYQSRGTFHATEQLQFKGEGLYRSFLHWSPDIDPPVAPDVVEDLTGTQGTTRLGYYGNENDVSYCIVTRVLAARLTRWQLVMEDTYRGRATGARPAIWLARGAPRRWFAPATTENGSDDSGFAVADAPTRIGRISFNVSVAAAGGSAAYSVAVGEGAGAQSTVWKLRWPAPLKSTPRALAGCTVEAFDAGTGIASVRANANTFRVEADF